MPARRELHTGRENFLHSRWSALEPYDDSMPEILNNNGIYTHLTTDHVHYWEDEGFGYHTRYQSFQFSRGQEGDPVWGAVDTRDLKEMMSGRRVSHLRVQDTINRAFIQKAEDFPQSVTFQNGLNFLEQNYKSDNWFLHIETFDPHEPFYAPAEYRALYGLDEKSGQDADWPDYGRITEADTEERLKRYQKENMALVSFCSNNLGHVLDTMDKYGLWRDTMLIINTDHGFLLGEHGWLGKNTGPYYNEIANIPLFIYDPRNERNTDISNDLVQTVDLPATILDLFGIPLPKDMTGRPVRNGKRNPERDFAIWGIFGGQVNCTDGQYVYMKAPNADTSFNCYTMSGLHFARGRIQRNDIPYELSLGNTFSFSKGYPLFKVGKMGNDFQLQQAECGTLLFDIINDPKQERPIKNEAVTKELDARMAQKLKELDAPGELYDFYNLPCGGQSFN